MKKDKRITQAEQILDVLEETPKHSNLMGGFVTILVGMSMIKEVANQTQ